MELDYRARAGCAAVRWFSLAALGLLAACGGGGGGPSAISGGGGSGGGGGGGGTGSGNWTPGVFQASASFEARCANPRSGNDPDGRPWPDVQGSVLDENNFLRSYSDETYLWYSEIPDQNPALFSNPVTYFDQLITPELLPSGRPKDSPSFHFTQDTDEYLALFESGVAAGYGATFAVLAALPPRRIVVAFTEPGSPATDNALARGAEVLRINGVDVVNDNTQAGVDIINAGLFPSQSGETYSFEIRDLGSSTTRTFDLTSEAITMAPVQNVGTLPGYPDVGYLLFNDHITIAEDALIDAVDSLNAAGVSDLIIDLRYNGGGFLYIAAQLAYMIAGPGPTANRTFELTQFNDKHPVIDPVTGATIEPTPFYDITSGRATRPGGQQLPTLDLDRVFVLTGNGSCSASEALINGLRGVDVDVVQVGSTTCGKPYGFYPTDNCGTTYFTIQFQGVNDKGFGDYAEGFVPSPSGTINGSTVPGCDVGDDFTAALGDPAEARLSAALFYRDTGACPTASPVTTAPATGALNAAAGLPVEAPPEPWRNSRIVLP